MLLADILPSDVVSVNKKNNERKVSIKRIMTGRLALEVNYHSKKMMLSQYHFIILCQSLKTTLFVSYSYKSNKQHKTIRYVTMSYSIHLK